jgi:hypothetical protein
MKVVYFVKGHLLPIFEYKKFSSVFFLPVIFVQAILLSAIRRSMADETHPKA